MALREASHHFRQGLSLIDKLPASAERDELELSIREPLNAACTALPGWAAPEVGTNAAAILQLTSRRARRRPGGPDSGRSGSIRPRRDASAIRFSGRTSCWTEGEKARDLDMQIFGHGAAMISSFYLGQLLDASKHGDAVLALYDPQQARRWMQVTAHDLRTLVGVWECQWTWMLGYPDQAVVLSDEKDAYARQLGDAFNLGFALTLGAYTFDYRCEPARLLDRVGEVERLERERSVPFMDQVMVPQARGWRCCAPGSSQKPCPLCVEASTTGRRGAGAAGCPT